MRRIIMLQAAIISVIGLTMPAITMAWINGQEAVYVIGQPDFTSNSMGTSATTLSRPGDVAIDAVHGKMYVSDGNKHRILRYAYPISGNQPAAEMVFGQPDFSSADGNNGCFEFCCTARSLYYPSGIFVDNSGRLWVADSENHRVLWFNHAYAISANYPDADGVLGQADFSSGQRNRNNTGTPGPNTFWNTVSLWVDASGTLFVSDVNNHRVLRFDNAAKKSNGANADGVLGQPDFTGNSIAASQNGMKSPEGICMIGSTLFVAEFGNHRVLRFDNASAKSNGANADSVLGQPDFVSHSSGLSQNQFNGPSNIVCDGSGRLYVGDLINNRVMIFDNALSKANGANADSVLGQPDFVTNTPLCTKNRTSCPAGLRFDELNKSLFIADMDNSRVLQFEEHPAFIAMTSVSSVKAATAVVSAVSGGNGITERGFFWWTDSGFTSGTVPASGMGEGTFSLMLTGLKPQTAYSVSAYIRIAGQIVTSGNKLTFTTLPPHLPDVYTSPQFTAYGNEVTVKGGITDVGSSAVRIYGFVYAKHPNPTVWDEPAMPFTWDLSLPISEGKSFEGTIKNLSAGETYYFRAYAHNNEGTAYGEEYSFTVGKGCGGGIPGDMNKDSSVDLSDLMIVLRILSGISAGDPDLSADVSGDCRIGAEEAVFVLQTVAELRK